MISKLISEFEGKKAAVGVMPSGFETKGTVAGQDEIFLKMEVEDRKVGTKIVLINKNAVLSIKEIK